MTNKTSAPGWLEKTPDQRVKVLFERQYAVTREQLWQALTDTDALAVWFPEITLDPRAGGEFQIWFGQNRSKAPDVVGVISVFEPPARLTLGSMSFEISANNQGCKLVFSDILYFVGDRSNEDIADAVLGGWHAYMDRLTGYVVSGQRVMAAEPDYRGKVVKGREWLADAPRQDRK